MTVKVDKRKFYEGLATMVDAIDWESTGNAALWKEICDHLDKYAEEPEGEKRLFGRAFVDCMHKAFHVMDWSSHKDFDWSRATGAVRNLDIKDNL